MLRLQIDMAYTTIVGTGSPVASESFRNSSSFRTLLYHERTQI